MGLLWVRLDTAFPSNHKILVLVTHRKWRAAFVWTTGLAYAGAQGTDGYIPTAALPFIHATRADAATLVEVGLWQVAPGGWLINDWDEYQPSNEETQARSKHAQDAARARWDKVKTNGHPP